MNLIDRLSLKLDYGFLLEYTEKNGRVFTIKPNGDGLFVQTAEGGIKSKKILKKAEVIDEYKHILEDGLEHEFIKL